MACRRSLAMDQENSRQFMWALRWTKRDWDRTSLRVTGLPSDNQHSNDVLHSFVPPSMLKAWTASIFITLTLLIRNLASCHFC